MRAKWIIFGFLALVFVSCSNKYAKLAASYRFRSADGNPQYADLDYWAAHPWKWDPSDSIPAPLRMQGSDSLIDVFFLHPTSFTKGKNRGNAFIDDALINAKTDYTTILYQASVFNQHARVFAPRYRQAHIKNFFLKDQVKAGERFAIAYADIKKAFQYYLEHWNRGRPFILASHSQGSLMAERLYMDLIGNKPLEKQMVAAYILGWPIPKEMVPFEKICSDSLQVNCLCSWRTVKKGFVPRYLRNEKGNSWVTNPLSWTTTGERIPREKNLGSVLKDFNRIFPATTDARIENGLLYVKRPKFPWSFLYVRRNYHIADLNLYYLNIRRNIEQRIRQYNQQPK